MNKVYRKRNFNIYQFDNEYIIHNTNAPFTTHHTHIKNFKTAQFIIDLVIHKSIPHHLSLYLLESLRRITDDKEYKLKISNILESKSSKDKIYYYNRGNKNKRGYPKRLS